MTLRSWQLRALRAGVNWSQHQLAKKAGVDQSTISRLEKGAFDSPGMEAITAILAAFQAEGWYLTRNGIEKKEANTYTIDGPDCYLRLLDLIHGTLKVTGGEWLLNGSDECRCSPEVIAKTRAIRRDGIPMRSLVRQGDRYLLGPLNEYRWMPELLFVTGDVQIIFAAFTAQLVTWTDEPRVIVTEDEIIAQRDRRYFEYFWSLFGTPDKSTAGLSYDDDGGGG